MGIDTIKDPSLRKNWKKFIDIAHTKLNDKQIDLLFALFKNDGSYSKAKTKFPGIYFVFAHDSNRTWVELELKAKSIKGEIEQQMKNV